MIQKAKRVRRDNYCLSQVLRGLGCRESGQGVEVRAAGAGRHRLGGRGSDHNNHSRTSGHRSPAGSVECDCPAAHPCWSPGRRLHRRAFAQPYLAERAGWLRGGRVQCDTHHSTPSWGALPSFHRDPVQFGRRAGVPDISRFDACIGADGPVGIIEDGMERRWARHANRNCKRTSHSFWGRF